MNSKANMEFTLFLNTKYRITMSLGAALGDDSIHLLETFESDKKVFDDIVVQLTKTIRGGHQATVLSWAGEVPHGYHSVSIIFRCLIRQEALLR